VTRFPGEGLSRVETSNGDSQIAPAALRQLPAVNTVLEHDELAAVWQLRGREAVVRAVRAAIDEARLSLQNGQYAAVDAPSLARRAREIVGCYWVCRDPLPRRRIESGGNIQW